MVSVFRKSILWGALAVVAVIAISFIQRKPVHMPDPSEFNAIVAQEMGSRICIPDGSDVSLPVDSIPISFMEATNLLGEDVPTKTFSLSVSDANGDDRDDILIGAHNKNPYLFINSGSGFTNESPALFPKPRGTDRHGYTFADLDDDGDLDLAIASGGSDGVGKGAPNIFLRNDTKDGVLNFVKEKVSSEMAQPAGRSRSFIPVASADGKAIDLYYATLQRNGFPNQIFRNARQGDRFLFRPEKSFLSLSIDDHGRGTIADLDGDGGDDYLVIDGRRLRIFWHPGSGRGASTLSYNTFSTAVGDFNNDGLLDIFVGGATLPTFIGGASLPTKSDNLTHSSNELIYVVNKNGPNDISSISFKTQSQKIELNLGQHIPATVAGRPAGALDIFLGKKRLNPKARIFTLGKQRAAGEPESFDSAGIYIWYSTSTKEWNMKWIFHDTQDVFKGIVKGTGISNVTKTNFLTIEPKEVSDKIFINQGNGTFSEICETLPSHAGTTSGSTIADFNNDGWLDIIGVGQPEQGLPNGDVFVLTNNVGRSFTLSRISPREKDRLQRSDLIAHGFFNDDEKPDIIMTNGFGQIPGNSGSPRLMLNNTQSGHQAIMISLEGTNSNTFGIGATATLTDARNNIIGYRVQGLNTNISQDTHWMHFGLGNFPAPYNLKVDWPDNTTTNHPFDLPGKFFVKQ